MREQRLSRDERITAAALDLLRTKGPAAVTVEAVAARSGVAKTTIYRRYRNRNDMLTAALASITEPPPPTNPSELVPVVEWLVEQSYRAVHDGIGAGGLAALLTAENRDYTELLRSIVHQHRAALASVIRDAMNNQVVRGDIDVETVMDCIAGAYLAELARSGSVAPGWTERVLRTMLPALETGERAGSLRDPPALLSDSPFDRVAQRDDARSGCTVVGASRDQRRGRPGPP